MKVIEIQEIVLAAQKRGATQKWVYENEIYPRFLISYSTFNNYLAINAKRELELLNKQVAETKRQLKLDFETKTY